MPTTEELSIVDRPSPNRDERYAGAPIDILVLHYTGMPTGAEALARLCDREAAVSAHYVIEEDGTVFRLVDEAKRAWHAGVAAWSGERDVNSRSIGIELVNPGHEFGYRPFTEGQMASLLGLAGGIVARYGIPPARVLGHSDVAPARKQDPGELFDWRWLARKGIGLWIDDAPDVGSTLKRGETSSAVRSLQLLLSDIGYDVPDTGRYDAKTEAVVRAFQRHFRPQAVTGEADGVTRGLIERLAAAVLASP